MNNSLVDAQRALFAAYDRRFAEAVAALPERRPWVEAEREEIRAIARRCLGIRIGWKPTVTVRHRTRTCGQGFVIEHLRATSWPAVHASADLYLPAHAGMESVPAVLLGCGHGKGGKRFAEYQRMAAHLVRLGAAVLVPDNIGQGEREPMGHRDAVTPFACGTSLQGLIVLETMGWLDWLERDSRVDARRVAVIGNSGGGTLSLFLGALREELAAVSSSGYPSSFAFVARKEKRHCACNVIPGIVGQLEMWHLLGCVAPRPLLICQGDHDSLFPNDLFRQTAERVRGVYGEAGAARAFQAELVPGEHGWDANRRQLIGRFLARALSLPHEDVAEAPPPLVDPGTRCLPCWPEGALDTRRLSEHITGHASTDADKAFADTYPLPSSLDDWLPAASSAETRHVLAQFEAFLAQPTGDRKCTKH
jgi:dienelactone hydrolase